MRQNRVYLVGAGPGRPDLITVRGLNIIKKADVILYDYLINPMLLSYAKTESIKIFTGKKGGIASTTQEEINSLILKYSKEDNIVVRLKGGDPWIFSRGGEEVEFLKEHAIEYEIVPGITSPIAATSYAGIPISHRDCSSSIAIATGHPKSGKTLNDLTTPKADTLLYVMGIKNLLLIKDKLINSGYKRETPAALIQNATLGNQKTISSTLENICDIASKHNISAPAIFVLGECVKYHDKLSWFDKLPLFGKRIIVTRPIGQEHDIYLKLIELGADVMHIPTIEINENQESASFFNTSQCLNKFTDIIFTSQNGVRIFFKNLFDANMDARDLSGKNIYAIGPTTKASLKDLGIIANMPKSDYSSEGLINMLDHDLNNRTFLLPRSNLANSTINAELESRGAKYTALSLYNISKPKDMPAITEHFDGAIFTSSQSAINFLETYKWPFSATAFLIGRPTANAIKNYNINNVISKYSTTDSIIESILKHWSNET